MADRHASQARAGAPPVSRARSATTAPSVRRNLFQSQLTRRPTATSSTSAETLRLDTDAQSESSDIVIRDKNGEIELGEPPTPPIDDLDELPPDARQDNEKERQRLSEAVKQHQIGQNSVPSQPEGTQLVPLSSSLMTVPLTTAASRAPRSCPDKPASESRSIGRRRMDVQTRRDLKTPLNKWGEETGRLVNYIWLILRSHDKIPK